MPFSNHLVKASVQVPASGMYVLDVTAGNGVEVVVNGRTQAKHLNPFRTACRTGKMLVGLSEGENAEIELKRFFKDEDYCDYTSPLDPFKYAPDEY